MKYLTLLIIFFSTLINCFGQATFSKKTTFKTVDCDKEINSNPKREIFKIEFYSKTGKLSKELFLKNDTIIKSQTIYSYDNNENIVLKQKFSKSDSSTTRYINNYNNRNQLTSIVYPNKTVFYTYNKQGKIITETKKYESHETKTLYSYDEHGNCLTKRNYGFKMSLDIDYKYNDKNLLTSETVYRKTESGTTLYEEIHYEYDQNQNNISRKYVGGVSKQSDISYKYNEDGFLIEKTINNLVTIYTYNDKGLLISSKTNPMGLFHNLTEFKYE